MRAVLLATLSGLAAASVAQGAEDGAPSTLSFAAFGTLGIVHSSDDQADFVTSVYKPNGVGYTNRWSAEVDSLLGGQMTVTLSPRLSAVVQVIAEQRYDDTFEPQVEWANLKYDITPDLSIRIGRTTLPTFMFNDSRKVAYALAWVRPPTELYSLDPVTSNDGFDLSYRLHVGSTVNTLQVTGGQFTASFPGGNIAAGKARARDVLNVAYTFEHGFTSLRANYGRSRLGIDVLDPFFAALRQFGPQGSALADRFEINGRTLTYVVAGVNHDPGAWFTTGEWAHSRSGSALGDRTAWYLGGGARLATLTPYLNYSQMRLTSPDSDPGLTLSLLPPQLTGPATAINAGLNAILSASAGQSTRTLGIRWDFMRNLSLKLQYDRIALSAGSVGYLANVQPGFERGGKVHLLSATVDFVR